MDNKLAQKKNQSSIQVLKTLKVLMQGEYSMFELISELNRSEKDSVFNNSVISKYINTCRFCGIEIPKINNRYYVATIPFGLELNDTDLSILKLMQSVINNEFTGKCSKVFSGIMKKLNKYTNKKMTNIDKKEYNFTYEIFEKAISQKRKIKFFFKNRVEQKYIPISIEKIGNKTFFYVYNKRIRQIDINRLSGIKMTDETFTEPLDGNKTVVFKLKGNLAKRYEARENETVQQNSDGTIVVTNTNENEERLISRLLRYDDKCEVMQPTYFREKMKNVLDEMLKNYGA